MRTEIYIEALLADQVWEAWGAGEIDDMCVLLSWAILSNDPGSV